MKIDDPYYRRVIEHVQRSFRLREPPRQQRIQEMYECWSYLQKKHPTLTLDDFMDDCEAEPDRRNGGG